MFTTKKTTVLLLLLLFSLALREMPYLNLLIISKLWIFYLTLLFLLLFPLSITPLAILIASFLFISFFLTLLEISYLAELVGAIIYFLLWIVVFLKVESVFKK